MRDIRKQQQREAEFYQRQGELQACVVCGRYFTARRKEPICSMGCKEKADAADKKSSWRGD